jgi:hypothetical protein
MTPILYWSMLLLICGFAFFGGRQYERIAAAVCLGASILTLIVHAVVSVDYAHVEQGDMLIDFVVLASFIAIALQSDRFWPLWIAGFQLTSSTAHLLKAIDPELIPQAYAAAERFWSYPILLILAVGAWRSYRRTRTDHRTAAT